MHNYYGQNAEIVVVEDEYGRRAYKENSKNVGKKLKQENKIEELERQRNFLLKFLETNPSIVEKWKQTKKSIVLSEMGILATGGIASFIVKISPLLTNYEGFKWLYALIGVSAVSFGAFMAKELITNFKNYKEEREGKEAKVYYLDEQLKVEYEKQKELGELKSVVPEKEIILEPTKKINNEPMIGQIRKNLEEWRRFFLNQRGRKETYQIYTVFQEEILKRERIKKEGE